MRIRIVWVAVMCLLGTSSFSQQFGNLDKMDNLFRFYQQSAERGLSDTKIIMEGYLNPLMTGIGFGMSNGWLNTAKPHSPGGFDINFNVSIAAVPAKDLFFQVPELQEAEVVSPADGAIPTIVGPTTVPTYRLKSTGDEFGGFGGVDMEGMVGRAAVPTPMAQIGIGVIQGTDVKLRYIPNIKNTEFGLRVNMLGVGVMHDIAQYFSGGDKPDFNISAFAGFTRFNFEADLSDTKDGSQLGTIHVNSVTAQVIASKTLSIFTVYGGAGATRANLNLAITGDYDTNGDPSTVEVTDPLDMNFAAIGPKFFGGAQLKFAILTLYADYTFQKYNTFTAGLGFTVK